MPWPDAVFKTIGQVFSSTPPQAVIVEGVDPQDMEGFLQFADRCAAANYSVSDNLCGEPQLVAHSARQIGMPVFTGEPLGAAVLSFFKGRGYSLQDLLAHYVMRMIPFNDRFAQLTETTFPTLVEGVLGQTNHTLGMSVNFTAADFAAWYAKNMRTPVNYLDLTVNETSPALPGEKPTNVLHALSRVSEQVRDENIVRTVKSVTEKYDRVLIVYGASHLEFEWKELVDFLGTPRKSKPFEETGAS